MTKAIGCAECCHGGVVFENCAVVPGAPRYLVFARLLCEPARSHWAFCAQACP